MPIMTRKRAISLVLVLALLIAGLSGLMMCFVFGGSRITPTFDLVLTPSEATAPNTFFYSICYKRDAAAA